MSGAENGAELAEKSDERSGEWESEKRVERSGPRSGGCGAVSGLNLLLVAAQACPLLSLHSPVYSSL